MIIRQFIEVLGVFLLYYIPINSTICILEKEVGNQLMIEYTDPKAKCTTWRLAKFGQDVVIFIISPVATGFGQDKHR